MSVRMWQHLDVFVLMALFSLLFTLINDREQKAKKGNIQDNNNK